MRISDWSSDVCSSDLDRQRQRLDAAAGEYLADQPAEQPQPRHAEPDRDQTDQDRPQNSKPDSFGEGPQARLEMHSRPPTTRRSEERHVAKERIRSCTSGWSPNI